MSSEVLTSLSASNGEQLLLSSHHSSTHLMLCNIAYVASSAMLSQVLLSASPLVRPLAKGFKPALSYINLCWSVKQTECSHHNFHVMLI